MLIYVALVCALFFLIDFFAPQKYELRLFPEGVKGEDGILRAFYRRMKPGCHLCETYEVKVNPSVGQTKSSEPPTRSVT